MTETRPVILVIEDDPHLRMFLSTCLSGQDGWSVITAETGTEGLASARSAKPALVILDLGLPDMDGVEVVDRLRKRTGVPLIILSARNHENDITQALDAGADDYLTKPFSTAELVARIRALLRRASQRSWGPPRDVFQVGDLKVELTRRKVSLEDREIHLTPIEYRLLTALISHAGSVVTHRQLLNEVWGPGHTEHSHYVRIYMGQLRHKIEADPARPRYLLTEPGVGYRLCDDV
ncbi:response regulator [Methylocaldum gracile]|jgi:two-component system KDP operon response regulator KdpE|uniref:response regulator n=1 Tax=unclassified Methylocaldum TaxID=2622260 RepID=UPI001060EB21